MRIPLLCIWCDAEVFKGLGSLICVCHCECVLRVSVSQSKCDRFLMTGIHFGRSVLGAWSVRHAAREKRCVERHVFDSQFLWLIYVPSRTSKMRQSVEAELKE
jgi:hypothetical protein